MTDIYNAVLDSSRWHRLKPRDGDIIVASWPKSGTTWMQQIVTQMEYGGDPDLFGQAISPWIECRYMRGVHIAEAQSRQHRRILKTHLPADALPRVTEARYVFVARDPRDMFLSWHRHQSRMSDAAFELINRFPGRKLPHVARLNPDFPTAFDAWLDNDDAFVGPFWSNVQSWWDARNDANVALIHYSDMTADLDAVVRRLAVFLGITIDAAIFPAILHHCSLDHMRGLAERDEALGWTFSGDGQGFIHKGAGGRWRSSLSADALRKLDATVERHLSADCARWLMSPLAGLVRSARSDIDTSVNHSVRKPCAFLGG